MKFYFPDSQDQVSPTYDFMHDEHSPLRVRQRDDKYAHEVLTAPAYDGVLVSKAIVDGSIKGVGKYSMPQRQRLYRLGVRGFFRLPEHIETLGDCGAFNYVNEPEPPYSVHEVLDFYEQCGFDAGVSVDHVILGFRRDLSDAPDEWKERRRISLTLAEKFKAAAEERDSSLQLLGAAQGWDPASYADSVRQLQDIGYDRIALGGMVPLKTTDILACLLDNRPYPRARDASSLAGDHTIRSNGRVRISWRNKLRQHVVVPPVVHGRPRQLPHHREELRGHQGSAGRWEPDLEEGDPVGSGFAAARDRSRTSTACKRLRAYDRGEVLS